MSGMQYSSKRTNNQSYQGTPTARHFPHFSIQKKRSIRFNRNKSRKKDRDWNDNVHFHSWPFLSPVIVTFLSVRLINACSSYVWIFRHLKVLDCQTNTKKVLFFGGSHRSKHRLVVFIVRPLSCVSLSWYHPIGVVNAYNTLLTKSYSCASRRRLYPLRLVYSDSEDGFFSFSHFRRSDSRSPSHCFQGNPSVCTHTSK